jgi:hypothetical protein
MGVYGSADPVTVATTAQVGAGGKEVALMRRIILVVMLAAVMTAVAVLGAGPVLAVGKTVAKAGGAELKAGNGKGTASPGITASIAAPQTGQVQNGDQ